MLIDFPRQIHLHQQIDGSTGTPSRFVELRDQLRAVHRVNHVETFGGLASLVGLKMTDQMPADCRAGEGEHLRHAFLNLVLPEIDLAGVCRQADVVGAERLGNGDESNR